MNFWILIYTESNKVVIDTSSRKSEKFGSCVHKPNIIKSASSPYKQWRVFGS